MAPASTSPSGPASRFVSAASFDVTGTLIHAPRLAEIYCESFRRHGHQVTVGAMRRMIPEVWREVDLARIAGADRFAGDAEGWWGRFIARLVVRLELGMPTPFLIRELFDRFARAESWEVYPEVEAVLDSLSRSGLRLGVVSNWDERLPRLLGELGLARRFEAIVYSAEVGHEKPHPRIFERLLACLDLPASRVVHVGDSRREDCEGARAAGLMGLHLDRRGRRGDVGDLEEAKRFLAPRGAAHGEGPSL